MKTKITSAVLAVLTAFAFTGCGSDDRITSSSADTSTEITETTTTTAATTTVTTAEESSEEDSSEEDSSEEDSSSKEKEKKKKKKKKKTFTKDYDNFSLTFNSSDWVSNEYFELATSAKLSGDFANGYYYLADIPYFSDGKMPTVILSGMSGKDDYCAGRSISDEDMKSYFYLNEYSDDELSFFDADGITWARVVTRPDAQEGQISIVYLNYTGLLPDGHYLFISAASYEAEGIGVEALEKDVLKTVKILE